MKSHYIVKKVDSFGRITLPKEFREHLKLLEETEVRLYLEENRLFLEKHKNAHTDLFENEIISEPIYEYHGKKVSKSSIIDLANLAGIIHK